MDIDPTLRMFLWGFAGSYAVEIFTFFQEYLSDLVVPERYKRFIFWILRFFIAVIAGGLVVAYDIHEKVLAIHIGISAPLIIQALARTAPSIVGKLEEPRK